MTRTEDEVVSALFDMATAKIEEQREEIDRLRAALIRIRDLPPGEFCCNQAAILAAQALPS